MEQHEVLIRFTLPGEPIPKARARTYPKMDKNGKVIYRDGRPVMISKTPSKTRAWEEFVSLIARKAAVRVGLNNPIPLGTHVTLGCIFYMPIPSSWPQKKKDEAKAGVLKPTSQPDLSNLIKVIEDGSEKVLWHNDAQITCYGTVNGVPTQKLYSREPRTEVEVRAIVDFSLTPSSF